MVKLSPARRYFGVRPISIVSLLSVVILLLSTGIALAEPAFADPAFQQRWDRSDKPITEGKVSRSWLWGPAPFKDETTPYKESPNGQRQVEWFDKARMEINNPAGDRTNRFFITNGLLVVELMTGRLQVGDNTFIQYPASTDSIAGDVASANPGAPTYATFAVHATLNGNENQVIDMTGQLAGNYLSADGSVRTGDAMGVKYAFYESTLRHNIPDVFWNFMNQQGVIYDKASAKYINGGVIDWLADMGYPLTEAYWTTVKVGGVDKTVLVQAFQRRVLTFTPGNPAGYLVEMGNVGRHNNDWRTRVTTMPSPTPTPVVTNTPTPGTTTTPTPGTTTTPTPGATVTPTQGGSPTINQVASQYDGAMNALKALKKQGSVNVKIDGVDAANGTINEAFQSPDRSSRTEKDNFITGNSHTYDDINIADKHYSRTDGGVWKTDTNSPSFLWPTYTMSADIAHNDSVIEGQVQINGVDTTVIKITYHYNDGSMETDRVYIGNVDHLQHQIKLDFVGTVQDKSGKNHPFEQIETLQTSDPNVPITINAPV